MFKKSLLALSVATIAASANAGTIYTSFTDTVAAPGNFTVTPLAAEALGADGLSGAGANPDDDNCDVAATDLGVTLANSGNGEGGSNDVVTFAAADTLFNATTTVTMTGAGACTVVLADTVSTTTAKSPIEAAAGSVTLEAFVVPGLGGYKEEDTLTLNFSGADIDTTLTTAPLLRTEDGDALDILDITASTIRFTVPTGTTVTNTDVLHLEDIILDSDGLSSTTDVKIDMFATNTSGTNYDVIAETSVHGLVPQYSAAVTFGFNGVIDVSQDRKVILANDDTASGGNNDAVRTDNLKLTVTRDSTTNHVTSADITFVIDGDFSWLVEAADANEDGTTTNAEIQTYLGNFVNAGAVTSVALNADQNELTIVDTAAANAAGVYDILLTVPAAPNGLVLNPTDYTVTVSSSDGAAAPNTIVMTAGTDLNAGEWVLNGSVVTIPYMPFDDNTAVIMRHTNTGVQTGDITVRYMLEGVSTKWEEAGVIGSSSRGVQNIRDLVIDAIKDAAGVTSGKVAIEITTNVPQADVTVYAAFRVKDENDRGFVGTFGNHGSAQ